LIPLARHTRNNHHSPSSQRQSRRPRRSFSSSLSRSPRAPLICGPWQTARNTSDIKLPGQRPSEHTDSYSLGECGSRQNAHQESTILYAICLDTPCAQRGRTMASWNNRRRCFEAWVVQTEREKTLVRAEAMQFRIRSLEAEVRRQYAMRRESADRQINVNSRAAARLGLLRSAAPGDLVSAAFWTLKSNWAWSRHCVGRNEGSECVRPGPGHSTAPSSGDLSQDQQRTNRIYEAVRQRTDSRLDHRLI